MQKTVNGMEHAGFWKRAAAWVIDIFVVVLPLGAIFFIFAMIYSGGDGPMEYIDNQLALMRWKAILFRAGMLACMLYWSLMESSARQATLGKRVMKIKVVDLEGRRISFGKAAGRALVKGLLSNIFAIGYIITLFTKKSQALHDIIAGCLVVKQSQPEQSDATSLPKQESPTTPSLPASGSEKPTGPPPSIASKQLTSNTLLHRFLDTCRYSIKEKHNSRVCYTCISVLIVVAVLIIGYIYSSIRVSKDFDQFKQIKSGYERMYWLANNYYNKVALWRFSAILGNAKSAYFMGILYETPLINDNTKPLSVKWHTWAAWLGNSDAQYRLGKIYLDRSTNIQDDNKAIKWLHRAALQFHGNAEYWMGKLYYDGRGTTQDYLEAEKWFRKAAFQGVADAQFQLGYMYDIGQGVEINDEFAADCYEAASEQGNSTAQYNLGLMYEHGEGVSKSTAAAVAMYRKAANQGNEDAWQRLRVLEE